MEAFLFKTWQISESIKNYFIQIMFSKREGSVLVVFESFHTYKEKNIFLQENSIFHNLPNDLSKSKQL